MASALRGVVVVLLSTLAAGAGAFTFTDGTIGTCTAAGRTVIEIGSPPGSSIHKLGYTGITSQAGSGYQITWNTEKLKSLPPVVHDFIFFHECAHARIPTRDELRANCEGLKDMRAAGRAGFAVEEQAGRVLRCGQRVLGKDAQVRGRRRSAVTLRQSRQQSRQQLTSRRGGALLCGRRAHGHAHRAASLRGPALGQHRVAQRQRLGVAVVEVGTIVDDAKQPARCLHRNRRPCRAGRVARATHRRLARHW